MQDTEGRAARGFDMAMEEHYKQKSEEIWTQEDRQAFALYRLQNFLAAGGDPNDPRITRILRRVRV